MRLLPLGTPVVPPEEITTARSSGRARLGNGVSGSAAARASSRVATPGTGPTAATVALTSKAGAAAVSGNTTTSRGANCAIIRARRSGFGGTDRYTAAAPMRCAA